MPAVLLSSGGLVERGHLRVWVMHWEMVRLSKGEREAGRQGGREGAVSLTVEASLAL